VTLLFIGDSITDAGRRDDPEGLGSGWVRLAAAALRADGETRPIVNTGVGGDRAVDLRRRWADDVLAHEPEVLTVYVGINDTWRRFDSGDATTDADFAAALRDGLERAAALPRPPRLILMEPFVAPVTDEQAGWHVDLDGKRRVVRDLARERGADLVPLHDILAAAAAELGGGVAGAAAIADDGVHPTPEGARRIADAWLAAYRG
jgi:acyl-CoA thioesterase I